MTEKAAKGRETFVAFLLLLLLGGAIFFFLNFVSFGIFFYVLVVMLIFTMVGFLHYLLWGHSLSQEVAGEREEQEVRERMEGEVFDD